MASSLILVYLFVIKTELKTFGMVPCSVEWPTAPSKEVVVSLGVCVGGAREDLEPLGPFLSFLEFVGGVLPPNRSLLREELDVGSVLGWLVL